MPSKSRLTFSMNTGAFCTIWRNHLGKHGADNWTKFVLACFKRFTEASCTRNIANLKTLNPTWKRMTDDQKFEFLSERCYAKAVTIQRKLRQEEDLTIALPDGYKTRKGKTTTRLTTGELADIFRS